MCVGSRDDEDSQQSWLCLFAPFSSDGAIGFRAPGDAVGGVGANERPWDMLTYHDERK